MEHYFILFSIVLSYLDLESLAGAKKTNKNTLSHLISRGCKRGVTKSADFHQNMSFHFDQCFVQDCRLFNFKGTAYTDNTHIDFNFEGRKGHRLQRIPYLFRQRFLTCLMYINKRHTSECKLF